MNIKPNELLGRRIPTVIGLVVLVGGILSGVILVQRRQPSEPKAAAGGIPKQIQISNVTDKEFAVSWLTDEARRGWLVYGERPEMGLVALDERDESEIGRGDYEVHYVAVKALKPETRYYFAIKSGEVGQTFNDQGKPYEIVTGPMVDEVAAEVSYGKILDERGGAAEGVLVVATVNGSAKLSTLTQSGGNWAIVLSTARRASLESLVDYNRENEVINIFAQGSGGKTASAKVLTNNDEPVPNILLGQVYDFTQPGADKSGIAELAEKEATPSATKFFLEPLGEIKTATASVSIANPSYDGEPVQTQQPEFRGTGPAGLMITITVESETVHEEVVEIGADGNWSWAVPETLSEGEHTVTISYLDEGGLLKQIIRSFTVYGQMEPSLPAFEATPTASPRTAATPTPKPTPTPTATPTPKPTVSPTPSVTATPTASPRVSQPATSGGVPTAGRMMPTVTLMLLGLGLVVGGIIVEKKI